MRIGELAALMWEDIDFHAHRNPHLQKHLIKLRYFMMIVREE